MPLPQIEEIQTGFELCQVVVLADVASNTVLYVSATQKQPQERMDALCEAASDLLSGGDLSQECIVDQGSETLIFLKSPVDPAEALLCICETGLDIGDFLTFGRSKLEEMANA